MGDLLAVVTLISGIVTIITGGVTIASFARQRNAMQPSGPAAQAPQPVAVPKQSEGQPVQQAPANIPPVPRSDAPATPPYYPGPAMPYQPAYPEASAPLPHPAARTSRNFVHHPVTALGGLVAQILWVITIILSELQDSSGQYLYQTDPAVSGWIGFVGLVAILLTAGFLIYSVVKAIRLRRWGWLVEAIAGTFGGFFFFSGIALIIFGLWAPTTRRAS